MAKGQSFKAGDTIVQEYPWMHCIALEAVDARCYHCLDPLTSINPATMVCRHPMKNNQCSGCKFARYCSIECQKKDWKERHQYECRALKSVRFYLKSSSSDEQFLIELQIVAKLTHPKTNQPDFYGPKPGHRAFTDLISHVPEIQQDAEQVACLDAVRLVICTALGLDAQQVTLQRFLEIHGKIKCNAFAIQGMSFEKIGTGVFIEASQFDHSCAYNAVSTFSGRRMTVTALEQIESVSSVRIAYCSSAEPWRERQRHLTETYFFTCDCVLCADEKKDAQRFSLRCVNPKCTAQIPSDQRANLPCLKCKTKPPTDRRVEASILFHTILKQNWFVHPITPPHNKQLMVELEKKALALLHPKNPIWPAFYVKKAFFLQFCGDVAHVQSFDKALELYRPMLSSIEPQIGWLAWQSIDFGSKNERETFKKLEEASRVMAMTFGKDHLLVKEAERVYQMYAPKFGGQRSELDLD